MRVPQGLVCRPGAAGKVGSRHGWEAGAGRHAPRPGAGLGGPCRPWCGCVARPPAWRGAPSRWAGAAARAARVGRARWRGLPSTGGWLLQEVGGLKTLEHVARQVAGRDSGREQTAQSVGRRLADVAWRRGWVSPVTRCCAAGDHGDQEKHKAGPRGPRGAAARAPADGGWATPQRLGWSGDRPTRARRLPRSTRLRDAWGTHSASIASERRQTNRWPLPR